MKLQRWTTEYNYLQKETFEFTFYLHLRRNKCPKSLDLLFCLPVAAFVVVVDVVAFVVNNSAFLQMELQACGREQVEPQ